jgi:hypothetical protein
VEIGFCYGKEKVHVVGWKYEVGVADGKSARRQNDVHGVVWSMERIVERGGRSAWALMS